MFRIFLFITLFFIKNAIAAPSFEAIIDGNSGQILNLELRLLDADPKSEPDISKISDKFRIISKSRSSNISIINGKKTMSKSWIIGIFIDNAKQISIPAISIKTDQGTLYSKKVNFNIKQDKIKQNKVKITSKISKSQPFINEILVYNINLQSPKQLYNLEITTPKSDNLLIEEGIPVSNEVKIINGKEYYIYNFKYNVTALKNSDIILHPFEIKADIPVNNNNHQNMMDNFGFFGNAFMAKSLQPIFLKSKKINLKVKDAKMDLDQWLPLKYLKIEEEWGNYQNINIGEPISRKIKIIAKGIKVENLPQLNLIPENQNYKIYQDKIDSKNEISLDAIPIAVKNIDFAIIPQNAGTLDIAEIKIPWFNLKKNKIDFAILPKKSIKINSGNIAKNPIDNQPKIPVKNTDMQNLENNLPEAKNNNKIFILVILLLVILLIMAIFYIIILKRKSAFSKDKINKKIISKEQKLNLKDLKLKEDISDIMAFLQEFSHQEFALHKGCSISDIKQYLIDNKSGNQDKIKNIFNDINAAIYANKKVNINAIREELQVILKFKPNKKQNILLDSENILNPN